MKSSRHEFMIITDKAKWRCGGGRRHCCCPRRKNWTLLNSFGGTFQHNQACLHFIHLQLLAKILMACRVVLRRSTSIMYVCWRKKNTWVTFHLLRGLMNEVSYYIFSQGFFKIWIIKFIIFSYDRKILSLQYHRIRSLGGLYHDR